MASVRPVLPGLNDDFFLADAIDFNMANNPTQPLYTFADLDHVGGTKSISHLEFGRATHRAAHLLRPNREGAEGEVVALIAHTDTVLYHALVAGLVVAGCVPFPISPRNSPEAIIELLTKTSCSRLLTTHLHSKPVIDSIRSLSPLNTLLSDILIQEIPSIASVYPYLAYETADHPFEPYQQPCKRPSKTDICIYLHSSGSTGNPRPIPLAHLYWPLTALPIDLKEHNPRLTLGYMFMPPFHSFGLGMQLLQSVFGVLSGAVYPPNSALAEPGPPFVPSPENVLEHMMRTKSNALIAPPTFLQIWAFLPDAIAYLKTLEFVGFGGGPLAPKIGNLLVDAGVRLYTMYGGTEFGMATRFIPIITKYDWEYMQFHEHLHVHWASQGDGTFECQFLSWEKHRPSINNLPDTNGYATSDLWIPHPTDQSLWKLVGRIDDVIVHSTGEKTVPSPMEAIVVSNPLVRDAVIFGRERDQTGILIELQTEIDAEDEAQLASLRTRIWPTVEEANSVAPAHSRIFKEMIIFVSKGKPLPRAGKGTVQRKSAVNLYRSEINALYENEGSTVGYPPSPSSWSIAGIETWLIDQTADLLSGSGFNPTADLFDQGFDSLYATSLRLRVIHALRTLEDDKCQGLSHRILPDLVYAFPVIKDLARFVSSLLTSEAVQGPVSRGANAIEAMIAKYTFGLATSPEAPLAQLVAPTPATVLLTGSTGNLGSQILARLLEDPRVSKVYAYNRPPKAGTKTLLDRHIERFEEAGLDAALLRMEKLVLIAGNATESYLGLDRGIYSQLCKTVNVVIHNAWRLDFNLSLASFEPNIQGMRHFIDLALSGPNPSDTRFLFISSIAAIQNWDKSKGPVPEDVVEDVNVALGGGYGEAKHVCERILLHSGLKGVSIRPGQICGGRPNGTWPTTEWLPILVKSSVSLRAIPDTSGLASWLGGDTISAIIVDVALSTYSAPLPSAFNLIHPRPVEQSAIIKGIIKGIAEVLGHELKLVPFNEWIAMVEERFKNANSETWATVPAVKLLEFFRNYAREDSANVASVSQRDAGGLPSLSTEKVQRESVFMHPQRLKQIGDDDTKLWVSYWHATGYLT